jgi:hypothetical protein
VRRVTVTVLVGLFGLVLGATIGFVVGQRQKLDDSGWFEAVGTWAGGVTLLAVILGAIAYFSEEFASRHEQRRQADAKRAEEQRLQLAADHVFCDIRVAGTMDMPVGQRRVGVDELEIAVDNRSGSVVTDMVCVALLGDFHWQMEMRQPINNGDVVIRKFQASGPPLGPPGGVRLGDLRNNGYFTFSLNGHLWSRKVGDYAVRLTALDQRNRNFVR